MSDEHGVVTVFHETLELVKQSLRREILERREAREQDELQEAAGSEQKDSQAA